MPFASADDPARDGKLDAHKTVISQCSMGKSSQRLSGATRIAASEQFGFIMEGHVARLFFRADACADAYLMAWPRRTQLGVRLHGWLAVHLSSRSWSRSMLLRSRLLGRPAPPSAEADVDSPE